MPLTFGPQTPLTFPLKGPIFYPILQIIDSRKYNEPYNEAQLQDFFNIFIKLPIGRLDIASQLTARVLFKPTTDLADLVDGFSTLPLPARIIQWHEESKALRIKSKSATSSRSSANRAGVRVPDFTVQLFLPGPKKHLILHVAELKIDGDDRLRHWRVGMAQAVLYLAQTNEAHGTNSGTFMLDTSFARLYAAERTIYLEVAGSVGIGPHTIQDVLAQADTLAAEMPHDIAPRSGTGVDAQGICNRDLLLLYNHFARVRDMVRRIDLDAPLLRVPASPSPDPDPSMSLPHLLGPAKDDSNVRQLSDLELLDLVGTAHPKEFPKWWVEAKRKNIIEGRPDDLVPETARPRSKKSRTNPSGRPGASGGAGAGQESGGGGGAGDPDSRGGSGGGAGEPDSRDALANPAASLTLRPISPPYDNDDDDDDDEAYADAHRAHWLRQQEQVADYLPVSAPPPTPDTSPAGKGKGRGEGVGQSSDAVDAKLYHAGSIMLTAPRELGSCQDDDDSYDDSSVDIDRLKEEAIPRLAARFTLAGWRIQLVSSDEYDRVVAQ